MNKMLMESIDLPTIDSISTLARETRLTEKLLYFLTRDKSENRYVKYYISKKDGGTREICAPCFSLKVLQRWVLESILYKVKPSQYSIGFVKTKNGSPLVRCARYHVNNLYILKMDLKDFFSLIKKKRVFSLFRQMGYNAYASNLLANTCTYEGKLPQGAVTSPYIANLICYRMDIRIAGYCNKRDITYTRYADDLIFSGDNRDAVRNIYGMAEKIIKDEGFAVNSKKTRFLTPKVQKRIIGVTINNGIKAPKEIKHMVRSMIHSSIMSGNYCNNDRIRGYIAYINSIEKNYQNRVGKYIMKYYEKEGIILSSDLVNRYNNNKIIKSLPNMIARNESNV